MRTLLFGVGLAAVVVILFRVTVVRDRWLEPVMIAFSIVLVGWIRPLIERGRAKTILVLSGLAAFGGLVAINGTVLGANLLGQSHNLNIPYPALAAGLREAGFPGGTIIANGTPLAGNLRMQFKDSRVISQGEVAHMPTSPRPLLIVWGADQAMEPPGEFVEFAHKVSGVAVAGLPIHHLEVASHNGPKRSEWLGFMLVKAEKISHPRFLPEKSVALGQVASYSGLGAAVMTESQYIDKQAYLSVIRMVNAGIARAGIQRGLVQAGPGGTPRFIPFLTGRCGLTFRGRVLEIGAGGAWFSAELSKLPNVVEVTASDCSPKPLREQAPKVFKLLRANTAKITRIPGDVHKLDFPRNHFDFVVSSAVLYQVPNLVQALREIKRVLKPGGKFVAIREPICPLVNLKSRAMAKRPSSGRKSRFYTLADYKEHFKQAGLPVETRRINLSSGLKLLKPINW